MLESLISFFVSPQSSWSAARNGREDGKRGIPTLEQEEQPPFVITLKEIGEENIARLAQRWETQDARLLADYHATSSQLEYIGNALEKAEADCRTAKDDEKAAREEHVKHFHLPHSWYIPLIVSLGIVEVPINSVIFQLLGESRSFTLIMSLTIAAATRATRCVQMEWHDWERYSNRQESKIKLGGVLGTLSIGGATLTDLLPLIIAGEFLHLGAATSFGLGRYRVML